jgi:hypothetical protein
MTNAKARILGKLSWLLGGLIALTCLAYLTDFAILRWRFTNKGGAIGTVTVNPYFAVPRKDHKLEYMFQDSVDETCVLVPLRPRALSEAT